MAEEKRFSMDDRLTTGGYPLTEVASAFQKSIRRGLEEDALYWASELDMSGFAEYMWKRLRIVVSEDIGLASPGLMAEIQGLYMTWQDCAKKEGRRGCRLFIVHAVLLCSRAPKSRMVDNAGVVYWENHEGEKRPIPDWALDKHTKRGRKLGRKWGHFWTEGSITTNTSNITDEYLAKAQAIRSDSIPSGDLFDRD